MIYFQADYKIVKKYKRRLSIAVSKKKNFGDRPRQEILKIEICIWNKKTIFFLMFIRFEYFCCT